MNAGIKLLDIYVKTCKHTNDSETARALKIRPSAVNNWRHGRAMPNAAAIEAMCKVTGESAAHWMPLIEAERARTPDDKKAWLRLAQVTAVASLILAALPGHTSTESTVSSAHNPVHSVYYVKL